MRHKVKSLIAWFLVLLQCINLLSASALAAGEKGTISSSFTYDNYTIKVVCRYFVDGDFEREEVYCVGEYNYGDRYSYQAPHGSSSDGYTLSSDYDVSGVVSESMEIVFRYDKVTEAYVTVSYSKDLCDYLNDIIRWNPDFRNYDFNPERIIAGGKVKLGQKSSFKFEFPDLYKLFANEQTRIPNISSFHTYYYSSFYKDWVTDPHYWDDSEKPRYLGYPIEGLSKDNNISLKRNELNPDLPIQNCLSFELTTNFPEDISVDMDTMSCCHLVLDVGDFNTSEVSYVTGVYRTVIEDTDTEDNIESWYKPVGGNSAYDRISGSAEEVKNNPNNYTLIEKGTFISDWEEHFEEGAKVAIIYSGRDKNTNEDVTCFKDGTKFEKDKAPSIEGYKCTNPNSPREFECDTGLKIDGQTVKGQCFYYDFVPVVTYTVTVKDKFIDESGTEIDVEGYSGVRQVDTYESGEKYSYNALGSSLIEGYRLVGDSVQKGTANSDKEIVFTYQKYSVYTITVKDKFIDKSGTEIDVEGYSGIRQVDTYESGETYSYNALSANSIEGYLLVGDSVLTGTADSDKEVVFTYRKQPVYTITVVDRYYDGNGNLEDEDIREEKSYKEGESYSYDALDPLPNGYILGSDENVSGVASEDTEIEFRYEKITEAYVTVSYSEELCNYLNGIVQEDPGYFSGYDFNATKIVARRKVRLGEESSFNLRFSDLDELCRSGWSSHPNISSFRTYYYDYDRGWKAEPHYLGYRIEGLSEDCNIRLERHEYDSDIPVQNCLNFDITTDFSEYINVDGETMSCCHLVLGMDGFDVATSDYVTGVYRTVIEGMDTKNNIEGWYKPVDAGSKFSDCRILGSVEEVKNNPNDFTLIEDGTRIRVFQSHFEEDTKAALIYSGKDKYTNKDVTCFKDGTEFKIDGAPLIEGYKCTNPNSPRKFWCLYELNFECGTSCYYYDYVPAVTYAITVKDKFIDESGAEIEVDGYSGIRRTDYVPEGESYSYSALSTDPIEGYLLVGDSVLTGTADSDKEVVFTYQKQPACTITVKDRFFDASGVEEKTDIRQVDTYEYDEYYSYDELDPVPDGYVYLEDYDRLLYGVEFEYETSGYADGDREIIFSYQKEPGCTITVRDKYVDRFGTEITTDIRCTENKYLGEWYEYDCASYDKNEYTVVGGHYDEWGDLVTSQGGRVTGDMEIVFTYQKIAEAYITVSYSEALCDYLNRNGWDDHVFSPDEEVEKFKVVLGRKYGWNGDDYNSFELRFDDISDIINSGIISSLHSYYYTDGGWSSDYYYLGSPVDGAVSKDPYINFSKSDDDDSWDLTYILTPNFPLDLSVEPDTDVCCRIVLDIDGLYLLRDIALRGVYRTVIDALDADARNESWYAFKTSAGSWGGIKLAVSTYEKVQEHPDNFEFERYIKYEQRTYNRDKQADFTSTHA